MATEPTAGFVPADAPVPSIKPADLAPPGAAVQSGSGDDGVYFTSGDGTQFKTEAEFLDFARSKLGSDALTEEQRKAAGDEKPKADDKVVEPTKAAEPPKAAAPLTDDQIRTNLKAAGGIYADPKYEAHAIAFERAGDLTPEQRQQAATDMGVSLDMVNAFVDAQKAARTATAASSQVAQTAEAKAFADSLYAVVGGPEQYASFGKWAAEGGLTKAQIDAYESSTGDVAKELLTAYTERWKASGDGPTPRNASREGTGAGDETASVKGFASKAEFDTAMKDPKYRQDESFRASVQQRLRASRTAGASWAQ